MNGLFFVMSMFGLKKASARLTAKTIADSNPNSGKWERKSFKENVLKIEEGKNKSVDSNAIPKASLQFNETRCHAHLIYGDGIKPGQSGVNGAHNKNNFYKTINDKFEPIFNKEGLKFNINECIESKTAHPTISGIEEIRYKLPAMNQNNTLNKGIYKKVKAPKTVYDPSIISDEKMIQWGKEAMENGKSVIIGNKIIGECSNGLKFIGYLDDHGTVKNFYPVLNVE